MPTRHLSGWRANRADSPVELTIDNELAVTFLLSSSYDRDYPLGRQLALWIARADAGGQNLAWDPSTAANQAAFEDLYERIRVIERRRDIARNVTEKADPAEVGEIQAERRAQDALAAISESLTDAATPAEAIAANRAEAAALARAVDPVEPTAAEAEAARILAYLADPILLPVRLIWLSQFPAAPVEIDAYDDGESYWVDEVTRDHMSFTVREALGDELGAEAAAELDALPPNSRGRYDVTEVMGGRAVIDEGRE